jgi:CopG-like RHH_1 or ribbon-helix-helix domain, RHH_5
MAKPRITVTVSEDVYEFLSEWSEREQRPLANLAAYLLTKAAQEYQEGDKTTDKT